MYLREVERPVTEFTEMGLPGRFFGHRPLYRLHSTPRPKEGCADDCDLEDPTSSGTSLESIEIEQETGAVIRTELQPLDPWTRYLFLCCEIPLS